MELKNKHTLQQAVKAHKAGKLQEAEALYRAILQAEPKHPDANHNLGVLAVSLNKSELAIPLFKTALESNPNQGQFWLSYIDALIKTNKLEIAKSVLKQGKKLGLAGESVDALEAQFNPIRSPSEEEVNCLFEHYRNGQYDLAENLAKTLTQQYPDHQFSWKVLGIVFKQTGRLQESLIANQRAVAISPNDAEAHSNLGNTLKEIGRLEEAEASYRIAIAINPQFAEIHSNLGIVLKELGRLEEAVASYLKAIAIKPENSEAHLNLGNVLQELARFQEAESCYRKAITIKPAYAEAHSNLGTTLHELGKLEEAEASYRKAISLKPDYVDAQYNLAIWYCEQRRYKQAAELFLKSKNFKNSQSHLLKCWFFLNEQTLFYNQLDALSSQGIADAIIGSFACRAEIKFGIEKENSFCSRPLRYVLKTNLTNKYEFDKKFVKPTLSILDNKNSQNRSQNLLLNGIQTSGNLFSLENILVDDIKKIIELEIENYRLYFKDSKEGLIKNWPDAYSLYGWLIRMKNGGALRPHMHENGWISGSIYINVPPKSELNEGNLVVCIEDDAFLTNSQKNKKNTISVNTGSLCLFPASLLHYTIPFESDEERIVLAFDVVPKNNEVL